MDVLYANLAKLKARSVTVYLDACFSGESPKGSLTRAASSIGLSHVPEKTRTGITVVTAARGDQLASWDEETKHGLFTRYLLEGLYGAADGADYGDGDGEVTLAEIQSYLNEEMTYQARRRFGRDQVATVRGKDNLILASVPEGGAIEPPTIVTDEPLLAAFEIVPMYQQMTASRNANVLSGPGKSHDVLRSLSSGDEVSVTGRTEDGEWYRIALANRLVGFVPKLVLQSVMDAAITPNSPKKTIKIETNKLLNSIGVIESINTEWGFVVVQFSNPESVRVGDTISAMGLTGELVPPCWTGWQRS